MAVYPMQTNFDMVVSFPMLRHTILTYITPGNGCTPELQIKCSRSVVLSHPRFAFLNGKKYMSGLFVFMQGDYTFSKLINDSYTLKFVKEKHANYEEWFNCNFPNGASDAEEVLRRLEEEDAPKRSVHDIANDPVIMLKAVMLGIPAEDVENRLNQLFGDETTLTNNEIIERLAALIHD